MDRVEKLQKLSLQVTSIPLAVVAGGNRSKIRMHEDFLSLPRLPI